jgi:hypothetical protein
MPHTTCLSRLKWTGWSCVSGPSELVDIIKIRDTTLTYGAAIRRVDLKAGPVWWSGMPTDWSAAYWFTQSPSGRKIFVFQHGGIEYIFTEDGDFDTQAEGALAVEMARVVSEMQEQDLLPQLALACLSRHDLDLVRARVVDAADLSVKP